MRLSNQKKVRAPSMSLAPNNDFKKTPPPTGRGVFVYPVKLFNRVFIINIYPRKNSTTTGSVMMSRGINGATKVNPSSEVQRESAT